MASTSQLPPTRGSTSRASPPPPPPPPQPQPRAARSKRTTNDEPKKRKPRWLRNGVVVGRLRQTYALSAAAEAEQSQLHLADSSTFARICTAELTTRCMHADPTLHPLGALPPPVAVGVTTFPNSPPVVDITAKWAEFRERGIHSRVCTPAQEVILACLIALGSRRSLHSSITGRHAPPGLPPEAEEVAHLELGRHRENACRALAERAIRLVESSGVLQDTSKEAMEAMAVFRVTLFAVAPGHQFAGRLSEAAHKQHKIIYTQTNTAKAIDDLGLSVLEADSFTSLVHNLPSAISDRELVDVYGWDPASVAPALQRLAVGICPDPSLQAPMRIVSVALLRGLSDLRARELPDARSAKEALALFSKYWLMMDTFESAMLGFEHPLSPHRTILPHLCAVPMILESQCMGQVDDFCSLHPDDPLSTQILLASRVRYLLWFKRFIRHMCDPQFKRGSDGPHMRALLLGTLVIYPKWVHLSLEASMQDARGSGPLSLVGLTIPDLYKLQMNLQYCSAVFAQSATQESELSEAFESMSLGSRPPMSSQPENDGWMAQVLVDSVLAELHKGGIARPRPISGWVDVVGGAGDIIVG